MNNYDVMYEWAHDKCVPLVREITFQNGEELTEEGLPFLILFHKMEDTDSLKTFSDEISRTLISERVRTGQTGREKVASATLDLYHIYVFRVL